MMPPWSQMTPQQQQMLLQMMMSRGTAGMQFGQLPGMMQQPPGAQMANPLTNQMNPAMGAMGQNPAMMQYLMGLQGQGQGGMQQPSLAQLLQMRGTGLGL